MLVGGKKKKIYMQVERIAVGVWSVAAQSVTQNIASLLLKN